MMSWRRSHARAAVSMRPMRILVIGGMEFMGRRIVELLVAARSRGGGAAPPRDPQPRVRRCGTSRRTARTCPRLHVSSQTAASTPSSTWPTTGRRAPRRATSRPRLAPPATQLQRYVFMSSIAAYPPGLDLREDDPLAPDDFPDPYVQHKAGAERLLFRMHADIGLPGRDLQAAVRPWPPTAVLPRAVLLGPAPRRASDHPPRWRRPADAVGVRGRCGRLLRASAGGPRRRRRGVQRRTRRADERSGRSWRCSRASRASSRGSSRCRGRRIATAGGELMGERLYFGEYLDLPPLRSVIDKAPRILGVSPVPLEEALRQKLRVVSGTASARGGLCVRRRRHCGGPALRAAWLTGN